MFPGSVAIGRGTEWSSSSAGVDSTGREQAPDPARAIGWGLVAVSGVLLLTYEPVRAGAPPGSVGIIVLLAGVGIFSGNVLAPGRRAEQASPATTPSSD